MPALDKGTVIAALVLQVRQELASVERTTEMARDEATSSESRAENQYDTRATEASYLAAGQGARLLAIRQFATLLEAPGAASRVELFELAGPDGTTWFLLAPGGGGSRVRVSDREVVVVTRVSPVGAALARSRAGELVRIGRAGAEVEYEVVAVA